MYFSMLTKSLSDDVVQYADCMMGPTIYPLSSISFLDGFDSVTLVLVRTWQQRCCLLPSSCHDPTKSPTLSSAMENRVTEGQRHGVPSCSSWNERR